MRSSILQQLKDLKALKDDDILSENEFSLQKEKLLKEMNSFFFNSHVCDNINPTVIINTE